MKSINFLDLGGRGRTINFMGTKGVTGGMKTAENNPASTNFRESNTTSTFWPLSPVQDYVSVKIYMNH